MKCKGDEKRDNLAASIFLSPNAIGFFIFSFLPVIAVLLLSFMEWDLVTAPKYVGLANYKKILGFTCTEGTIEFNDPSFWKYFYNTIFLMLGVPLSMFGSLVLAILFNKKVRFSNFFRTIYFIPSMCVPVAVFLLWRWILASDIGLLNQLLSKIGIIGPDWLTDAQWTKPAMILVGLWAGIGGFNMLLYLAALQEIPRELYEAADIDGAGSFQKFLRITWPMLTPATFFIFITSVISGFQGGFEVAYMMTRGGPAGASTTISYYIYDNAYQWFNMGYAAAIACVLLVIVFTVTLFNWRYGGRQVHYF